MKKSTFVFAAAGLLTLVRILIETAKKREKTSTPRPPSESGSTRSFFEEKGFRVSEAQGPGGTQVLRLRGSWEDLMRLNNPDALKEKPALPNDINIESLPEYNCGCPHCGAMSLYGEGQWRYQELSRTRGNHNNTTTYLTKCKKCDGFMKSTVDHDD